MSVYFGGRTAISRIFRRCATQQIPKRTFSNSTPGALATTQPKFSSIPTQSASLTQSRLESPASRVINEIRAEDILTSAARPTVAMTRTEEIAQLNKVNEKGMIFEISFMFLFAHYKNIAILLARNAFQTFRPIGMAFIMGNLIKAAFFSMGFPMLVSFYSVWIFEVFYSLLQCFISFLFVSMFYNNLCFRGMRPMMNLMRQRGEKAIQRLRNRL